MKLFNNLDIETASMCNRFCSTCIRNSHPDKEATLSFFESNYLPIGIIIELLDQAADMDFSGWAWLSHYNEPLLDDRIADIAQLVKSYDRFWIGMNTNGDFLNEELARELDGNIDKLIVTLYMDEPMKSKRKAWIETLFQTTKVEIITQSDHIATHFSPKFDVQALAEKHKNRPCTEPQMRVIVNHRQQYLLCCDDVVGNFDLGYFPDTSLRNFWFGEKNQTIMRDLESAGGRLKYSYCETCPRT